MANEEHIDKILNLEKANEELKKFGLGIDAISKSISNLTEKGKGLIDTFDSTDVKKKVSAQKELVKTNQDLEKNIKAKTELEKQQLTLARALEKVQAQKKIALSEEGKQLIKNKQELNNLNKATRENIKANNDSTNAYRKLSRETAKAQGEFKRLAAEFGINSKEAIKAKNALDKLDKELRQIDTAARDGRKDVGRYTLALNGLKGGALNTLGALGLTAGLAGGFAKLTHFVGDSVKVFSEFESISAKVQAISGAGGKEFSDLTDRFKELGSATKFSASEVADLALELSKLGFSTKNILDSTEAILDLAAATGEDLATSAKVTAATLKQFQKDASEAGSVADVMAKAFSSSALDLEKFSTAMAIVGPAANAVNVSLEETTATLAKVVDSGVDASTAGSALRNVYIDLADKGLSWDEAMGQINNSTNKLKTANELFGKRGAVVASIIANNTKENKKLTKSLENSAGAAKRMAVIMNNNLAGDVKAAESAMEGLQIAIGEQLNPSLRTATQGWTDMVRQVTEFIKVDPAEQLRKERDELDMLVTSVISVTDNEELRLVAIKELQKNYPDFLGNIDAENISNEQLLKTLEKVNKQYENRIEISLISEQIKERKEDISKLEAKQLSIAREFNKAFSERLPNAAKNLTLQEKYNLLQKEGLSLNRTSAGSIYLSFQDAFNSFKAAQGEINGIQKDITGLVKSQSFFEDKIAGTKRRQATLDALNNNNSILAGGEIVKQEKSKIKSKEKQLKISKELSNVEKRAALGITSAKDVTGLAEFTKALDEGIISIEEYNIQLEKFGGDKVEGLFSPTVNWLEKLNAELAKAKEITTDEEEEGSFFKNFKLSDEELDSLTVAGDLVTDLFLSSFDQRREAINEELSLSNERIEGLQSELEAEIAIEKEREASGKAFGDAKKVQLQKQIAQEKQNKAKIEVQQKKEAKRRQNFARAEATLDFAKEIAAIAGYSAKQPLNVPTAGAFGAALFGIQGALATGRYIANLALINKTKFAKGGVAEGPSHENGGIPFSIAGRQGYEMEGGEFITNKKATKENLPLLSAINEGILSMNDFSLPLKSLKIENTRTPEQNLNEIYLQKFLDEQGLTNEYLAKIVNKSDRTGKVERKSNGVTIIRN